jgi:hypothetical protein
MEEKEEKKKEVTEMALKLVSGDEQSRIEEAPKPAKGEEQSRTE